MVLGCWGSGLLSNQREKSTNFYFIRVPLRKKLLKYGTPKPRDFVGGDGQGQEFAGFGGLSRRTGFKKHYRD